MSDCIIVYDTIENWGTSESRPNFTGAPRPRINIGRTTPCCDRFRQVLSNEDGTGDPSVWVYWQELLKSYLVNIGRTANVVYCPWCASYIQLQFGAPLKRVVRKVPVDPIPMVEKEFIEPIEPEAKKDG